MSILLQVHPDCIWLGNCNSILHNLGDLYYNQYRDVNVSKWRFEWTSALNDTLMHAQKTQYYVAVSGQSAIYIGTYITAEPSVGELRFIARLKNTVLTTGPTPSNAAGE